MFSMLKTLWNAINSIIEGLSTITTEAIGIGTDGVKQMRKHQLLDHQIENQKLLAKAKEFKVDLKLLDS